jgi:hypothetical protein
MPLLIKMIATLAILAVAGIAVWVVWYAPMGASSDSPFAYIVVRVAELKAKLDETGNPDDIHVLAGEAIALIQGAAPDQAAAIRRARATLISIADLKREIHTQLNQVRDRLSQPEVNPCATND